MKTKYLILLISGGILLSACSSANKQPEEVIPAIETPKPITEHTNTLSFEEHDYDYDVVSGATSTTFGTTPDPLYTKEEKANLMFWSNQPPLGLLEGYYYRNERNAGGNYGIVEVVTNPATSVIENVEYTEFASDPYYERKYSGKNKRLSDYAFFQADNTRTDVSLVTVVNGITHLENQMRTENRLDGAFTTVKGASSSARSSFMPIAAEMKEWIKTPNEYKYFGIAETLDTGIIARLEVITHNNEIWEVRYDEYFADMPDKMSDAADRPFYRQSRYYSLDYNAQTQNQFIDFADSLSEAIIASQSLSISEDSVTSHPSFSIYNRLAEQINTTPEW